jgi:uncharacterized protein (TIGR00725 family)
MRRPVIGVMGGSKATAHVTDMATRLGSLVAGKGWTLLNGGRNCGVMAASARGARQAGGTVVGILPDMTTARASPDLDVAVVTGMHDGRNLINVLSSDVVIACPGKLGTWSEIVLALKHDKRVILLGYDDVGPELHKYRRRGQLTLAETPEDAVSQAATELEKPDG